MCHLCPPDSPSYDASTQDLFDGEGYCLVWLMQQEFDPWEPSSLYRCYNEFGELLYIGITSRRNKRFDEHTGKHWWDEVTDINLTHYDNRRVLEAEEQWAIITEHPMYNIRHNDKDVRDLFDGCEDCKRLSYPDSTSIMLNEFRRICHYTCRWCSNQWQTSWLGLTGHPSFQRLK